MKNNFLQISVSALLLAACAEEPTFKSRKIIDDNALGVLPIVPLTTSDYSNFTPAANNVGQIPTSQVNAPTTISVGQSNGPDITCVIPAGTQVNVLGQNGGLVLVNLPNPCMTANGIPLREGYIVPSQISFQPVAATPLVAPAVATNANATAGVSAPVCQGIGQVHVSQLGVVGANGCGKTEKGMCHVGGKEFRAGATGLALRVFGQAQQWEVSGQVRKDLHRQKSKSQKNREKEIGGANDYILSPRIVAAPQAVNGQGFTDIPFNAFIGANDWAGIGASFTVTPISNGVRGNPCQHNIIIGSPLALVFDSSKPYSVHVSDSKVKFDIFGNNQTLQTGWVNSNAGLLAIDLNNNGKVDSGRELFGEGTDLSSGKAEHGFSALASYDLNKDGMINAQDKVYGKLKVWIDSNVNGKTDKGELVSLKSIGVTAMSIEFTTVSQKEIAATHKLSDNVVKFKSKYFGPERCGKQGCELVDIFFATTQANASLK